MSLLRILAPFAFAAVLLAALHAVAAELLVEDLTDFGRSLNAPTPGFARFLALWMLFGTLAAGFLAAGIARVAAVRDLGPRFAAAWKAGPDGKWIAYGSIFAFLIPAALRTYLLGGAPLTDDESAYRFMAQVLAAGRVYADSPMDGGPLKLFFDNRFMINDGKLYAHYFLGWPALLVPGVWLGTTGSMNALYSALTVPALYLVLRRLVGTVWARAGLVFYLGSPMLMVAAATETSHTSCVMALAWLTWFFFRSRDPDAAWWTHGAVAFFFSLAFFIRPTSALGVGLPFLLVWAVWALRLRSLRILATFALPAMAMAALFLTVNKLQTGSFLEVAYQRAYSYAEENHFRFSLWDETAEGGTMSELRFGDARRSLAVTGAGFFRLTITLLGWPCSILFALFARERLLWLSALSYLALHFFTDNVGIDTFAPMHYFELAWPLLLLNAAGLARLTAAGAELDRRLGGGWRWRSMPAAVLAALVAVSLASYVPLRFGVIAGLAENIAMPWEALAEAEIERAVVFAPEGFIVYCRHPPARGWVFVRPNSDPWLEDDVLWVNHLSQEADQLLMRRFPDREGYVMSWDLARCRVFFVPLAGLPPGSLRDADVPGIDEIVG